MDRQFNEYVGLRANGSKLSDLFDMYGRSRCLAFEALYQKFFNFGRVWK
jgi:hypothetical protein